MATKISEMFFGGNIVFMSILTLLLALLFLAAWKAPAWVRSLGGIALTAGVLFSILGVSQIFGYMKQAGSVAPAVLYGGFRTTLIPVCYGLVIYIVSRIIHICQTPRI